MSVLGTAVLVNKVKNTPTYLKWLGAAVFVALISIVGIVSLVAVEEENKQQEMDNSSYGLGGGISQSVLAYEGMIKSELKKYNLEKYTAVILAIMQQESGGNVSLDVMQASESLGYAPNTITDPKYSIEVGIKHFAKVYAQGKENKVDIESIVQSYNFGSGYIGYIAKSGGKHSVDLAKQFSLLQVEKNPGMYTCGGNSSNFRYPYCYGDFTYVEKVFKNVNAASGGGFSGKGSALGQKDFKTVIKEMRKYEGWTYVFGGANPNTSFDCSGLMQWGFKTIGVNLPRTAEQQYLFTKRIKNSEAKPGDLIFFENTYKPGVSHVGIYLGNNEMYDTSGNPKGVGVKKIEGYWQQKFYAFGRIP